MIPHLVFVILTVLLSCYLMTANISRFAYIASEDGGLETMQFAFDLLSATLCVYLCRLFYSHNQKETAFLFAVGVAFFFFIAMEELSWGQRIFQYPTPPWMLAHNKQQEFNLHNISGIKNRYVHLVIGSYGVFSGLLYRMLSRVQVRWLKELMQVVRVDLFVIPFRYTPYFLSAVCYFVFYYDIITRWDRAGAYIQEVAEFFVSFGCYLVLFQHLRVESLRFALSEKKSKRYH